MTGIFYINFRKIINAQKLFRSVFGRYRFRIILIIILGFAGGLFGSVGIGVAIPLFSLVTGQLNLGEADKITKIITAIFYHKYTIHLLVVN